MEVKTSSDITVPKCYLFPAISSREKMLRLKTVSRSSVKGKLLQMNTLKCVYWNLMVCFTIKAPIETAWKSADTRKHTLMRKIVGVTL